MQSSCPQGAMVGRHHLLERALRFADDCHAASDAGAIIITSPAGVGKTRMVQEMEKALPELDFFVLEADPSPGSSVLSSFFGNWFGMEAAGSASSRMSAFRRTWDSLIRSAELAAGKDGILSREDIELCRSAVAYLSGVTGQKNKSLDLLEPKQRSEIIAVSLQVFFSILTDLFRPVVVLENVHWFSREELEYASRLIREGSHGIELFIITGRPDVEGNPPRLPETGPMTRTMDIELQGLSRDGMRDLIEDLSSTPASRDLTEYLWLVAGGIPLFILQVMDYLEETEAVRRTDDEWVLTRGSDKLPQSVTSVLDERFSLLPENARRTAVAASVLGSRFSCEILERIAGIEYLKSTMDDLSLEGILKMEGTEGYFEHILLRDWISQRADEEELKELHSLAAAELTGLYDDGLTPSRCETIAVHHLMSEDVESAVRYLRSAASGYSKDYDNEAAARIYRQLIPLVDSRERVLLELELYDVYEVSGLLKEGKELLTECLGRLEDLQDPCTDLMARVLVKLGGCLGLAGELERGEELVRDGLKLLEGSDELEQIVMAEKQLGMILMSMGRMEEAMDMIDDSIELAKKQGNAKHICAALYWAAIACRQMGDIGRMELLTREQVELAESSGLSRSIIAGYDNLMRIFIYKQDYGAAEAVHSKMVLAAEETGSWAALNTATSKMGIVHLRRGDLDNALGCFRKCVRLSRKTGNRRAECAALGNMAHCFILRKDTDSALKYSTELIDRAARIGFRSGLMSGYARMGYVFTQMGDYGSALECIQTQIEHAEALRDTRNLSDGWAKIAEIEFYMGEVSGALDSLERALEYSGEAEDLLLRSSQLAQMGKYCFIACEPERARKALEQALEAGGEKAGREIMTSRCRMFLKALDGETVTETRKGYDDPELKADLLYCNWRLTADVESARLALEILKGEGLPETHPVISQLSEELES